MRQLRAPRTLKSNTSVRLELESVAVDLRQLYMKHEPQELYNLDLHATSADYQMLRDRSDLCIFFVAVD